MVLKKIFHGIDFHFIALQNSCCFVVYILATREENII